MSRFVYNISSTEIFLANLIHATKGFVNTSQYVGNHDSLGNRFISNLTIEN